MSVCCDGAQPGLCAEPEQQSYTPWNVDADKRTCYTNRQQQTQSQQQRGVALPHKSASASANDSKSVQQCRVCITMCPSAWASASGPHCQTAITQPCSLSLTTALPHEQRIEGYAAALHYIADIPTVREAKSVPWSMQECSDRAGLTHLLLQCVNLVRGQLVVDHT